MSELTVSVVIPTWNSARFLPTTLDAVLGQTAPPLEVIVVDDGSTDDTQAVLEPYRDRLTYIRQPNFGGPSRPRNVGVTHATGDLVAFCDSDDVLVPDALESAVGAFRAHPHIDFLWGDYDVIDEQGDLVRSRGMSTYQDFRNDLEDTTIHDLGLLRDGSTFRNLLRGLFMGISAVVVRRNVIVEAGPFDEELKNSDDREMWLRIARSGAVFAYQDRVRFRYRKHGGSVSERGYLRMPSVISNLERQIPHIEREDDLDFVRRRINGCRLGYAWGLRREGDLEAAEFVYRQALAEKKTWTALRGLAAIRLMRLTTT